MSESKTNENKKPIDESNVDWSGFGELVMKMYHDQLKKGIPSEIKSISTVDEFKNYLERT